MEITKEMFERIPKNREDAELIVRPSISFWQDVWRRLKKNPVAMSSLVLLAVLVFMVIFGPYFTKFEYNRIDSSIKDIKPNSTYWFGTDNAGRDIFTRVWTAGRASLEIGLFAALLSTSIGVLYGCASGFIGAALSSRRYPFSNPLSGQELAHAAFCLDRYELDGNGPHCARRGFARKGAGVRVGRPNAGGQRMENYHEAFSSERYAHRYCQHYIQCSGLYLRRGLFVVPRHRSCPACNLVGRYVCRRTNRYDVFSVSAFLSDDYDRLGYACVCPAGRRAQGRP